MIVQTAFRLDESLVRKLKNKARIKNVSLNQYVTEALTNSLIDNREQRIADALQRLREPIDISTEISGLSRFHVDPDNLDERAAYILSK